MNAYRISLACHKEKHHVMVALCIGNVAKTLRHLKKKFLLRTLLSQNIYVNHIYVDVWCFLWCVHVLYWGNFEHLGWFGKICH